MLPSRIASCVFAVLHENIGDKTTRCPVLASMCLMYMWCVCITVVVCVYQRRWLLTYFGYSPRSTRLYLIASHCHLGCAGSLWCSCRASGILVNPKSTRDIHIWTMTGMKNCLINKWNCNKRVKWSALAEPDKIKMVSIIIIHLIFINQFHLLKKSSLTRNCLQCWENMNHISPLCLHN